MNLQKQCCTLEQATVLKALGIDAPATFWYMPAKDGPHGTYIRYGWHSDAIAPAYTVAELGELLPELAGGNNLWGTSVHRQPTKYWEVYYKGAPWGVWPTEAQARAEILICMLEQKHISAPDANHQLVNA